MQTAPINRRQFPPNLCRVLKKYHPNELQFYTEKTRVQSGQNSSSVGIKLQFCLHEHLFRTAIFPTKFLSFRLFVSHYWKKAARRAKNAIAQLKFYF